MSLVVVILLVAVLFIKLIRTFVMEEKREIKFVDGILNISDKYENVDFWYELDGESYILFCEINGLSDEDYLNLRNEVQEFVSYFESKHEINIELEISNN